MSDVCPIEGELAGRAPILALLDHLLEGYMILGQDWTYLYVNEAAARHGQQRPENLIGRTILQMYPGVERSTVFAAYKRCMEQRISERFESSFTFADGTTSWYLFSVEPVPEGILVTSLDITERVRAEEDLRRSRDQLNELVSERTAELRQDRATLQGILDATQESIWLFDSDGKILMANATALRRLRTAGEPVVGRHFGDFMPASVANERMTHLRTVIDRGLPVEFEDERRGIKFHHSFYPVFDAGHHVTCIAAFSRDITERRRAEDVLRETEQRFRLALKQAPVSVAIQDRDLRFIWAYNQRTARPDEIVGKCDADIFAPEDAARLVALKRRVLETGQEAREKLWLTRGDARLYVDVYFEPMRDDAGEVIGVGVATVDLTPTRLVEEALRRSEEALRYERDFVSAILDTAGAIVVVLDRQGRVIRVNRACEAASGCSAEELYHRYFWEVSVSPEDRAGVEQILAALRAGRGPSTHESQWVAKDGTRRLIAWSNSVLTDDAGKVLHIIATGIDVTARRAAEEVIKRSNDELDRRVRERTAELNAVNRTLRTVSACNEALVRASDEHELVTEICRIIHELGGYRMAWVGYAETDPDKTVRAVAAVGFEEGYLEGAGITWADSERGRGPTGTCIRTGVARSCDDFLTDPLLAPWRDEAILRGYASSAALPLKTSQGVLGALTIYADRAGAFDSAQVALLTELADDLAFGIVALRAQRERDHARRDAEARAAELRALAGELTRTEQRERQRLAGVLHDGLQQLLVGAKFRLGTLEGIKSPAVRHTATEVAALISDAIATSRSLTAELSPPILHEAGLVPGLEWLCRWMKERHGLEVELTVRGQVERLPEETMLLLFQATRELLFNVAKHAGVKTAHVEVDWLERELKVTVSDEGAGFDAKSIRVEGGRSGGFGLFSIRERLALMAGHMEIHSSPGKGTRACLSAQVPAATPEPPLELSASPNEAPTKSARLGARAGGARSSQVRVLLADDHVVMRQGLAELLRAEGDMDVVGEASDGKAALRLTRKLRPDVVLMDINMPGMTGIEVTERLHAELPDVRVIGLSMFDASEGARAICAAGAVAYCAKSAPPASLIAAIRASALPTVTARASHPPRVKRRRTAAKKSSAAGSRARRRP